MMYHTLGAAMIGLLALTAQADDPVIILGDKPEDVCQVLASGGPPVLLADGRLLLLFATGEKEKQKCLGRYSSDHGLSWSQPAAMFDFPTAKGSFGVCAALVSSKGTVHVWGLDYYGFDFQDREKSKSYLWHARSTDNGKTWSKIQYVPFGAEYTGSVNNACELSSGRILVPVSYLSSRPTGVWVSVAPYSDDDGGTWHEPEGEVCLNTGAADWYESGAAEPVCLELKDGRVWMLPRSQDGFHWESFSSDGGLHWSKPRHTRFVCNQSAMAPLRLRDGRLLLIWNNCSPDGWAEINWGHAERAVLCAALSRDEGKTWTGYREVARITSNAQVSYPNACQAADGTVILRCRPIMKFHPDFLLNTTLKEDFSQGLGRWCTLAQEGAQIAPDPEGGEGRVLRLIKPKADKSAAACLNFPFGVKGELTMEVRIEQGFHGVQFALTDFFALPGVPREGCFPLRVTANGRIELVGSRGSWLATPGDLVPGRWHALKLNWDCDARRAFLELDGVEIGVIEQFTCAPGVCYLRLRSTATKTDDRGFYIRSVNISVVPGGG